MHFEILTVQATQPNTGAAGVVTASLDNLTIKNGRGSIAVITSWATRQVAGFSQLLFPSGHDTTRGYRAGVAIGTGQCVLPFGEQMKVEAQEVLAPTIAGSNVAGDIELDSHLIWYENFEGIKMRTISAAELDSRGYQLTTIESSIAAVATGAYSEEAISSDSDLLKANTDYAVIGMSSRTAAHALTLKAPDFGNVRIGCPGHLRPEITSQWFKVLSKMHNKALIPVINSGNRAQINIGFCGDENAATTLVTAYLARLK